ncbi:DUF4235 domain-containing protein [Saccharothrix coeruleofusca]|uniref:Membrane protein n=1 Tax=Saccharothrix coeruleofusca TaxID=33919 RepID=A0A918AQT2_9PSEU|nr:DUF4235 domain-containing protein [Saccharothrix coeruleofusca]MBP2335237.1 hypothetical protein [Saccharothrix coeruleofusca]GGP71723.1 membrane protein [Saccharothrix coeruleofusca]
MNKLLYRPIGMLFSVLGGLAASAVFRQVWKLITGDKVAPTATQRDRGWGEVLLAATVQGAIFGLVKAAIDRGGATGYDKLTGEWPGDTDDVD